MKVATAPAVVLLHGQPGDGSNFDRVRACLPAGLTVLAPDRPGWGTSNLPARGLRANADWTVALLDECGIDRAVVVGFSLAGGAVLALAEQHPDRLAGLVLVSSVGPGCISRIDRLLTLPGAGEVGAFLGVPVLARLMRRPAIRRRFGGEAAAMTADQFEQAVRAWTRPDAWHSFTVEQRAFVAELPSIDAALGRITTPTIVLHGGRDHIVPMRTAEALAATIPGARLRVIDGGGHALPYWYAEEIADAVIELLPRPADESRPATTGTTDAPASAAAGCGSE